jgi:UDP-2,4-diacetamido-2,4,6-trideoxy-beta-L-altropyranose hydrolase
MPKILFRCDSTELIGTGHVTRSVALAEEFLNAGWEVDFYGNLNKPKWLNNFLDSYKKINVIPIGFKNFSKSKYEVICFDHYTIDTHEVSMISNLGKFIIWIVDDKSPKFEADLYISTLPSRYLSNFYEGKRCLFGLEYALIRKSIRSIVENRQEKAKNILERNTVAILTGGTENISIVNMFISQLNSINSNLRYLTNSKNIDFQNFENLKKITNLPKSPNFFSELTNCDYVISPASVTSWEVVYSRIPLAIYGLIENHSATYKFLTESGIASGLGFHTNPALFKVHQQELIDFINRQSLKQNKMEIDGFGSARIFNDIVQNI